MRKGSAKDNAVLKGLWGALASVPVIVLIDFALATTRNEPRVRFAMLLAAVIVTAFVFAAVKLPKVYKALKYVALAVFIPVLLWFAFYLCAPYRGLDKSDKAGLFADRNVMVIVPHEDDELNLMSGVIEEYLAYGSTVRVVFTTNGDYSGLASGRERLGEAINVLTDIGVPESNIIFLGYSDQMASEQGYFYNDKDVNAQLHSNQKDASATYGIDGHEAFNNGNSFTRMHFLQDIKACILQTKPDTLICVDHDGHSDHMATSLLFETAMGEILREETDYKPLVLKGMAYTTAFYSPKDFYDDVNILSTQKTSAGDYMEENHAYLWQDRLRMPVSTEGLSRSLMGCGLWDSVMLYKTQEAAGMVDRIVNGDKVFWQRATTSLTYSAEISASSGDTKRLSDFSLGDNSAIPSNKAPMDGVWSPSADDEKAQIKVSLAEPTDISLLKFYDAPSITDNVLKLTVEFDNGNTYEVGPLNPWGSESSITVDEKMASSFVVTIEEREGEAAGLMEIEAYKDAPDYALKYIKLTDSQGNFVYDYIIDPSGEEFSLYAVGAPQELNSENYTVTVSNKKCSAEIADGKIRLVCPRGESTVLCLSAADGTLSDSVYVRNPLLRVSALWLKAEKQVFGELVLPNLAHSNIWKIMMFLHKHI